MLLSRNGELFIKSFEGVVLKAYKDSNGIPTIGWGHTTNVHMGMIITQPLAEAFFQDDILHTTNAINSLVKVKLTQNQFDALTSFAYNVGIEAFQNSTLLRDLNSGDFAAVPGQFERWDHINDNIVSEGLLRRREAEAKLFQTPDNAQ